MLTVIELLLLLYIYYIIYIPISHIILYTFTSYKFLFLLLYTPAKMTPLCQMESIAIILVAMQHGDPQNGGFFHAPLGRPWVEI